MPARIDVRPLRAAAAQSTGTVNSLCPDRILVPLDFSAPSRAMLRYAVAFATRFRASLLLLHVVRRINVPSRVFYYATQLQLTLRQQGRKTLAEWTRCLVPADLPTRQIVCAGEPGEVIGAVARRERADLIIIATGGRGALMRFFLGGTAGRVLRHAPCPVLVVR